MDFFTLIKYATRYFSKLNIQFKDQVLFMKLLGYVLFFNKDFMTSYTTILGQTVYFPRESYIKLRPLSATIVLLHEMVHIYDASKISNLLFGFLYLFPQSLLLISIPLFWFSWKIALVLTILCLLPLPAYFRMYFERRAYFASLYVIQALANKFKFDAALEKNRDSFLANFKDSSYYFMWIFPNINKQFDEAIVKIRAGQRPFESPIFDILDDLVRQVQGYSNS